MMTVIRTSSTMSYHHKKLLSNLKEQQLKGMFTDIKIISKDSVFWAHACVLAPFSNLVSKIFDVHQSPYKNSFKWSTQWPCVLKLSCSESKIIDNLNYCKECIQKVIDFMYLGQIAIEENHLKHVRNIALFLEIEDLLFILKEMTDRYDDKNLKALETTKIVGTHVEAKKYTKKSENVLDEKVSDLQNVIKNQIEFESLRKDNIKINQNEYVFCCINLQGQDEDQIPNICLLEVKSVDKISPNNGDCSISSNCKKKSRVFKVVSQISDLSTDENLSPENKANCCRSNFKDMTHLINSVSKNEIKNSRETHLSGLEKSESSNSNLSDNEKDSKIPKNSAVLETNLPTVMRQSSNNIFSRKVRHKKRMSAVISSCTDLQVKKQKGNFLNGFSKVTLPDEISNYNQNQKVESREKDFKISEDLLNSSHESGDNLEKEKIHCYKRNFRISDLLCLYCSFEGTSILNLLEHKLEANHATDLECFLCRSKFSTNTQQQQHLLQHKESNLSAFKLSTIKNKKTVYTCEICGKKIQWRQNFLRHLNQHNKPSPKCPECDFVASSNQSLKYHRNKEHSKISFSCYYENCSFKSVKKGNLKDHILHIHKSLDNGRFKCSECSKTFSQKKNLQRHVSLYHSSFCKTYKCQFCQYTSSRFDNFQNHLITKHKSKKLSKNHEHPNKTDSTVNTSIEKSLEKVSLINVSSGKNATEIKSCNEGVQNFDSAQSDKMIDSGTQIISNTGTHSLPTSRAIIDDSNSKESDMNKKEKNKLENLCCTNQIQDSGSNFSVLNLNHPNTCNEQVSKLLSVPTLNCELTSRLSFNETSRTFKCHNFCKESTGALILNEITGELTYINLVPQQSLESTTPPELKYSHSESENQRTLILNESTGELYLIKQTNEQESSESNEFFSSKNEDDANLIFDPLDEDDDYNEFLDIDPTEIINENNSSTEIPVLNEWTGEINLLPNNFPGGPFLDEQTGQLSVFDLLDNDLIFDCLDEPTPNVILNENTGEMLCKTNNDENQFSIVGNDFSESAFVNDDFTYDNNLEYSLNENTGQLSISWPDVSKDSNFSFLLNELTGELSVKENSD